MPRVCLCPLPPFAKNEPVAEKKPAHVLVDTEVVRPACVSFQVYDAMRLIICSKCAVLCERIMPPVVTLTWSLFLVRRARRLMVDLL